MRFVKRSAMSAPEKPLSGLPMWFSTLLYMRGIDTDEKAAAYLHPTASDLYDPFEMKGMEKAVALIRRAVALGQAIVIYGDYDVDGMCAAAIMQKALLRLGNEPTLYLPDRHEEGYGLNAEAVRALSKTHNLLITVDCGITNHGEVALAKTLGMTVIVSDHHEPPEAPSPADAVLNPLLGYPFGRLCGAGVAFKMAQALLGLEDAMPLLPLCALATVADIVPLIDENRTLVHLGLALMDGCETVGLRALIKETGTKGQLTAQDLAFRLAPRLNAAGRLGDAKRALNLLISFDEAEAEALAKELSHENNLRRLTQDAMMKTALSLIDTQVDFAVDKAIILVGDDFNLGVVGLCAGKICEAYYYPTLVLSRRGDGTLTGSARSIKGVNIHQALTQCADLFDRFGGHAQAAGLTMQERFLPELRRRLSLAISEISDPDCYTEEKEYDLPMPLLETSGEMVKALCAMEPTGCGNPAPVFLCSGAHIQRMRRVGQAGDHLSLTLLDRGTLRDGIFFSMGDLSEKPLAMVDVLYTPQINVWNGRESVQLMLSALQPAAAANPSAQTDASRRAILKDFLHAASNNNRIPHCQSPALLAALKELDLSDETLRGVYRALTKMQGADLDTLATALALTGEQVTFALVAFSQLSLIMYNEVPFGFTLLPARKCRLADSPLIAAVREALLNDTHTD